MAGVYRPRHPERSVLYRVLFHNFDRFLTGYESRFERERFFPADRQGGGRALRRLRQFPLRVRPHDPLPAHEDCETLPASGVPTAPSGRKYIAGVVKLGTSSVGAGIRGVTEKRNILLMTNKSMRL